MGTAFTGLKTKKDTDDYLGFEMEGKVWIVSREKGKTTKTELEPKIVLGILANALTKAVGMVEEKQTKKKKK